MLRLFCSDTLGGVDGCMEPPVGCWVYVVNLADRRERRTDVGFLPVLKMDAECLVSSVLLWRSSGTLGAGPGDVPVAGQPICFTAVSKTTHRCVAMNHLTVRSSFPDDLLDPQCADPAGLEDTAAVVSTAGLHHCWVTTLRRLAVLMDASVFLPCGFAV